jgi:hypothetical protein
MHSPCQLATDGGLARARHADQVDILVSTHR